MTVRRSLLLVVAFCIAVAAAMFYLDAARGQTADTEAPPAPTPRVEVEPVAEQPDGLEAEPAAPGETESRMGLPSTNSTSRRCEDGDGSRVQLGMLGNSSVQKHCTGITGDG